MTFDGNKAASGGAIYNVGYVTMEDTIAGLSTGGNFAGTASDYLSLGHNAADDSPTFFYVVSSSDVKNMGPQFSVFGAFGGPNSTVSFLTTNTIHLAGDGLGPLLNQRGQLRSARPPLVGAV